MDYTDIGIASTVDAEFDRQLETLLEKGYPELAGMTIEQFTKQAEQLRSALPSTPDPEHIPFVIVVRHELVPSVAAVERFVVRRKHGFTDMPDEELDSFTPIDGIDVPDSTVYLLTGVDTGSATLNVRPNDALPMITDAGRTPLTLDEGVAVVTQLPEVLKVRNCFQALGSRCGDKRIPSFWVSYGKPRLGWCWAGNPHTWLGSGSATARYGTG